MKQKNLKKNYMYNLIYQIFNLLTPLVVTPYISRVLGSEGIGIYSFTGNVNAYFTILAALGTAKFGIREIAYFNEDKDKRSEIFWNLEILSCLCVLISLCVYILFLFIQKEKLIYTILALNIIAVSLEISWFFQGMENFGKIVLRNTCIKILYIIYIFVFIKKSDDLIYYILGLPVLTVISNASLWINLPKYVNKPKWKCINPFKYLKGSFKLFIPTIAVQLYSTLDVLMIGLFAPDMKENGYYEQALKIIKLTLTLVTLLSVVMIPRISHMYKKGDKTNIQILMIKSYNFLWFLGIPICFGLIGIADNFVIWFFGDEYSKVVNLIQILSSLVLIMGMSTVTGTQYLISTGREKLYTFSVLCGVCTNFLINIIFIPNFYSIGAAYASVLAELVIVFIQLNIIKEEINILKILKLSRNYFIAGLFMLIVLLIENLFLTSSIISIMIMIISGVSVYFVVLYLLNDQYFYSIIIIIKSKIKNIIVRTPLMAKD